MRRIKMTICLAVFIVMLSCTLGTAADKPKLTEEEQLEKIDRYMVDLRESVENNYQYRAAELKSRAERKIRLLEAASKNWHCCSLEERAEIAQRVLEINNCVPATRRFRINAKRDMRDAEKRENYYLYGSVRANYGPISTSDGPINTRSRSTRLFASFQTLVAEAKNDVYKRYESGCVTLEKNKMYDFDVVLPKLEEKLKQNLKESKTKVARGVVSGIVYSKDKKSAVVDGKIVQEGDLLGNVKIAKIHQDHIEFEGSGKSWTQKPGEPAGSDWSK